VPARAALGPSPAGAPDSPRASKVEPAPSAPPPQPSAGAGGPDLGWALACAGVLLAAAILAFSGDGGHSPRRGGAARLAAGRIAAALRPLLGRR
jgi:hypothetical protein